MFKFLKWGAIALVSVFVLLAAIGHFFPEDANDEANFSRNEPDPSEAISAAKHPTSVPAETAPTPVVNHPVDSCIGGVCIGATPVELLKLAWREYPTVSDRDLNNQQRELLDEEESVLKQNCMIRQKLTWGADAEDLCRVLARGTRVSVLGQYRPIQTVEVLKFFAGATKPVCQFGKEPMTVVGHLDADSERTKVELRFDATGNLRVYAIDKSFHDQNAETNALILQKLKDKHPYLVVTTERYTVGEFWAGDAPWGGTVRLSTLQSGGPTIRMKGNEAAFDGHAVAACQQANPVNVQ